MKVLFVDDMEMRHSEFDRQILEMGLNGEWEIWRAYDGERGLKLIKEQKFDVMFLDHDLADIHYVEGNGGKMVLNDRVSGTELAEAVANLPEEMKPSVVVVHSWNSAGRKRMMSILKNHTQLNIQEMFSGVIIAKTLPHILSLVKEVSGNDSGS